MLTKDDPFITSYPSVYPGGEGRCSLYPLGDLERRAVFRDVFYVFNPVAISLCGSTGFTFDTYPFLLELVLVQSLIVLFGMMIPVDPSQSTVSPGTLTAGTNYYIVVGGYDPDTAGDLVTLTITGDPRDSTYSAPVPIRLIPFLIMV